MNLRKLNISGDHQHDHHHHDEEPIEEHSSYIPAIIFDLKFDGEVVPAGFDAVKISLDGRMTADLSWKKAQESAQKYVQMGYRVFWEIDLGLFDQLSRPLTDQSQLLSLILSLEQFRDTLWQEFRDHTVGICLYRGPADFSKQILKDDGLEANWEEWQQQFSDGDEDKQHLYRLFCRDVAGEYLNLLASRLPDSVECFILLDAQGINDPLHLAQMLTKERFPRIHLGVKGARGLGGELAWEDPLQSSENGVFSRTIVEQPKQDPIRIGVCLPPMTECRMGDHQLLATILIELETKKIPFRVIPESLLTTSWDGLDFLMVQSQGLSLQGLRKLKGFCAAGGIVVVAGKPLELQNEISFENWRINGDGH